MKKEIFIGEYMNNYLKLLAHLANADEVIKDEDKALILLSSLLDEEYETFILTLNNGKQSLSYHHASTALMNHEVRRKNNKFSFSNTTSKTLIAQGIGSNHRKGKGVIGKSKTDNRKLGKNQCAFYKKEGHWKIDRSRLKKKKGQKIRGKLRTRG